MSEHRLTQTDASLNPLNPQLVKIKLNGVELEVPKDENVIESAKRAGIDVPYFCYHPRLSKGDAANCRMCLVEVGTTGPDGSVRMMPKPQTACTLPASEGLVVETETAKIAKDRRGILEFLLINHPLDCPVCDRGGECPLQNNTLFYGPDTSRYIEEKRHFPKAYPLSEHVVFDRERCIHCARCTRFTDDISGNSQLGFLKRGADMEVGTFSHTAYNSKFSGNVIELCPVGALLSRSYRFKARPWDLHTQRSVCSKCSNGCNIKIDYRLDQLQRVNARINDAVNEEWTCDKGKFGHDYVSSPDRLRKPLRKEDGRWHEISWKEAYALLTEKLRGAGSHVGGIGGGRLTNEDNYVFQKLFRETLKSGNIDHRVGRYQGPTSKPLFERFGYHGMGRSIADLEKAKSILVIGADLVEEQPILFLRIRKAWRYGATQVVSAIDKVPAETTKVGDFAATEMVYKPGSELALVQGLLAALAAERLLPADAEPTIIKSVSTYKLDAAAGETGVSAEAITAAAKALAIGPMSILVGKSVTENPAFLEIVNALGDLAVVTGNVGAVNIPALECNTQGAADMGVLPDSGPGYKAIDMPGLSTGQMLEAAATGKLNALWIAGADLVEKYHDQDLVRRAIAACPFVVVSELTKTATADLADLILPAASVAEKDGSYTNCERRIQRIYRAFDLGPDVKPDWLIFSEVSEMLGQPVPYFSARDVLRDIAANVPIYAGIQPRSLGEAGVRWQHAAAE